jgi:proline dehydrogenase
MRSSLLAAARSTRLRRSVEGFKPTRSVVARFVAGTTVDDAARVADELAARQLLVTIDHLGEDVTDARGADGIVTAYEKLLERLDGREHIDVSVKLTALGLAYDRDGALLRARQIVRTARDHHATVTIDMESSALTDDTLRVVRKLREEESTVAAVLQAMLRRTEADARSLGDEGARVRLCKGAYAESADVAYPSRAAVNASYVRCLTLLWESQGTPLVATHDPELIATAQELSRHHERPFEFQMLYGVRPDEQNQLAQAGGVVRVYVPYGDEWYGYLIRRLAERPANLRFFLRALGSKR